MSIHPRLNRLFATDGKCFDVAIDHGFFNEYEFLSGIENMQHVIETVVEADPDAIQLSPGQARILQRIPGKHKPSLVLRSDVANLYGKELPNVLFSRVMDNIVDLGILLDAACVVVNVFVLPDQPEVYKQCLVNVGKLKYACEAVGMPLMVEPLVMQGNTQAGGYMTDGDIQKIIPLVRQTVELGADIVKADPCDDIAEYYRVVEAAGDIPLLVRGGGRVSDQEILSRTYVLMQQGAKGIVYGRNVIQHEKPAAMTRALMSVVHDDTTPEQALNYLTE